MYSHRGIALHSMDHGLTDSAALFAKMSLFRLRRCFMQTQGGFRLLPHGLARH